MRSQARGAVGGRARRTGHPTCRPRTAWFGSPARLLSVPCPRVCGLSAGQAGHEPEHTERWGQRSPSAAVECGNGWLPFLPFPPRQTKFWQANSGADAGRGLGRGAGSVASSSMKSFLFLPCCSQRGRAPQQLSLSASRGASKWLTGSQRHGSGVS